MARTYRTKINSFERLSDALHNGPQTDEQLCSKVGKGWNSRITEWNRVYGKQQKIVKTTVNTGKVKFGENEFDTCTRAWKFQRVSRIPMQHDVAYPEYHKHGKYLWPKKQRELGLVD